MSAGKRKKEATDSLSLKKARPHDDSFGDVMTFEEELAMLNALEGSADTDSKAVSKVHRPPVRTIDPTKDTIVFQQLEVDHYVGSHIAGMPGPQSGPCPVLRMYGVNMEGNSVLAHVHGFLPYLYVPAPAEDFNTEGCVNFRFALNDVILKDMRSNRDNIEEAVLNVEIVNRSSILGFHFNQQYPFLKITVVLPKLVAPAKRLLENGINLKLYGFRAFQVFESNIEYEIRLMVDADVIGCNWIECPAGKYFLRKPWCKGIEQTKPQSKSHVQIELDISCEDFVSHPAEGDWQKCAPLRVLSFDIECSGRQGIFPEAKHDSVIQIANMVMLQGEKDPFIRNVFTLNSCAPIPGSDVRCFSREDDLLQVQKMRLICIHSLMYAYIAAEVMQKCQL